MNTTEQGELDLDEDFIAETVRPLIAKREALDKERLDIEAAAEEQLVSIKEKLKRLDRLLRAAGLDEHVPTRAPGRQPKNASPTNYRPSFGKQTLDLTVDAVNMMGDDEEFDAAGIREKREELEDRTLSKSQQAVIKSIMDDLVDQRILRKTKSRRPDHRPGVGPPSAHYKKVGG